MPPEKSNVQTGQPLDEYTPLQDIPTWIQPLQARSKASREAAKI